MYINVDMIILIISVFRVIYFKVFNIYIFILFVMGFILV